MKTKKSKELTIRQQIQQCPTLTAEERSLALYGLNKAKLLPSQHYNTLNTDDLMCKFYWPLVPVIKGQTNKQAHLFWYNVYHKLSVWKSLQ